MLFMPDISSFLSFPHSVDCESIIKISLKTIHHEGTKITKKK